ncbi:TPA: hypothetical protein JD836_14535 [Citrobacter freundii]|nr:hypothetical protein [Citrobacter freundii]HAT3963856.1 hypothetical protein [Citrobacter freundii]HAU6297925.1 hypothetical protein [Citrobacter freundii]HCD1268014.1 hypothetical protein [Citrobacter freundii]
MSVSIVFHPCFYFNAQDYLVCRDVICKTLEEAMDWAEIHAPLTDDSMDTCGGYLQVSTYDSGTVYEAQAMSRHEYDYCKSEAEDNYDPDAAYERHLENAGWMDQAFQEQMEARFGCLDYWQAKAVAAGRMPD